MKNPSQQGFEKTRKSCMSKNVLQKQEGPGKGRDFSRANKFHRISGL
jgi:hypothetical protein